MELALAVFSALTDLKHTCFVDFNLLTAVLQA